MPAPKYLGQILDGMGFNFVKTLTKNSGASRAHIFLIENKETGKISIAKELVGYPDKVKPVLDREVDILIRLHRHPHPNIAALEGLHQYHKGDLTGMDTGKVGGIIVMEYIDGIDLYHFSQIIDRTNRLFLYKIAKNLLSAVRHMHNQQHAIIHRDLSYNNIILVPDPTDHQVPIKAVVIDFGAGCAEGSKTAWCYKDRRFPEQNNPFKWPYASDNPKTQEEALTQLRCDDIWQVGTVLWQLAYNYDLNELLPGSTLPLPLIQGSVIPRRGGHPTPPDLEDPIDPEVSIEKETMRQDYLVGNVGSAAAQHVIRLYVDLVYSETRDKIWDFDPKKRSNIHDLIRMMLSVEPDTCFSADDLLIFINTVWDQAIAIAPFPQRKKFFDAPPRNCELPCEDPVNSFYEKRCKLCPHCVWDESAPRDIRKGRQTNLTRRCKPREPNREDRKKKEACDSRRDASIWNPYQKHCETALNDVNMNVLHDRYAILYTDFDTVPPAEVRRRILTKDRTRLDTYDNVMDRLKDIPYHFLKGPMIDETYAFYKKHLGRFPEYALTRMPNIGEGMKKIARKQANIILQLDKKE